MYDTWQAIPEQIRCAGPDEMSDIITAVIQRYSEVFPDLDLMVISVPWNDLDEQIRILQNAIHFLTRLKDGQK
jgi:hypothetical protein